MCRETRYEIGYCKQSPFAITWQVSLFQMVMIGTGFLSQRHTHDTDLSKMQSNEAILYFL